MALLGLLLRARFRQRWRSWLSLSLLIALVSGLVLTAAVAARRTASAFPGFETAHGYDALVLGEAPIPKIAALPGVVSATLLQAFSVGTPACACSRPINSSYFNVFEVAPRDLQRVVKLVTGRMPDQSDPRQVLASFTLAQDAGVHVGTVIRVPLYSASQRNAVLSGASVKPAGPAVALRVVGIEAAEPEFPFANAPGYDLYATQAFARMISPHAVLSAAYLVRVRHGPAGLPRFQTQARALGAEAVADMDTAAGAIGSSIGPQVVGWWILAGLAALAGIVVVAQALARQDAIEAEPNGTLSALGASQRQLVAGSLAATLVIAAGGATGGVALAFLLSPLTPVGEARIADPSTGFMFDALVLLPGAAVAVIVVLALGLWPAVQTARTHRPAQAMAVARPSRVAAWLAGAGAPPSALIGVRHALERGRGRAAVPVGSALLGSVLAVTALCATVVFGASLTHLTSTPALYGQPFDLEFSGNGPGNATQFEQMVAALERDRAISRISAGAAGDVSINGRIVKAQAGQSIRGPLLVTMINGHPPRAGDQVALGATTLRQLGAHVGSLVRVTAPQPEGGTRTAWYRVTGTTVFPPESGSGGLGTGALFSLSVLGVRCAPGPALHPCELQAVLGAGGQVLVRAGPGPRGQAALNRLARAYPSDVTYPVPPTNLVNFGEAVNFPLLFAGLLVLFALAALVHVLAVSVTRRRRETGLLKALGFVRRQITFAVSWQATTIALIGITAGVPAGIAAGRLIWRAFATSFGVVPVPVVIAWAVVAVAVGAVVIANLLAIGPAAAAARSRPASLLQAE
ncbi:MAG TPA: FtsX-like permease family protein [Streptosporangiaceae bacterium]|nr:FtsX-like permease family protein [Streptosporangiaceae bacterium]